MLANAMDERFKQLLSDLNDPDKYVKVPNVSVFDEHQDEFWVDKKTGKMVKAGHPNARKVVKKFTRETLQHMANHNNQRARVGDLAPLAFGHTIPDEPDEKAQPTGHGYALNFRTQYDPTRKKWMLKADYFIRASDYQEATTYPCSSIELWPEDYTIHPVSLLRRTPARDIGQWVYSRPFAFANGDPRKQMGVSVWRFSRAGQPVLRYAMGAQNMAEPWEDDAPADSAPMGGDSAPSMSEHEQYCKHCMSHPLAQKFAKQYSMADAAADDEEAAGDLESAAADEAPLAPPDAMEEPMQNGAFQAGSGTNGMMPGGKKPMQNSRKGQSAGPARYRGKGGDAAAYARAEAAEQRAAEAEARNWVMQLADIEGYDLGDDADQAEEVVRFARCFRKEGDSGCERYAEHIRKKYRPRLDKPVGQIRTAQPTQHSRGAGNSRGNKPQTIDQMTQEHTDQVLRYQREHKGVSFDDAFGAVFHGTNGVAH